ncbi:uncharacterized protein KY384_006151 [Bacidia gigantensis]|uniref:uncharacterized protein n=1 Tax=Bacidia gigantensis TaxID=2732470 RepID=UPI001D037415|nr:uncharacterized protein KY384_006151 [Bacidia gigantensis]KAG8529514.1 hypothetical protein KY384_006151 [Bacidia gigantensis]
MELVSLLGAAASAITVVQLCADCLHRLGRLKDRYKNADLSLRLLATQLSTLLTALRQISRLIDDSQRDIISQIVPELITSLDSCKLLIETLNNRLARLELSVDKGLTFRKKTQALWGERERSDFSNLLGHNVAALQLLLTALQCRSQSEQMTLLEQSASRQTIYRARDETSSLLWLHDDESHDTRRSVCTQNSELLDLSFVFDQEVFSSRAYFTTMKSNMKKAVLSAQLEAQNKRDTQTEARWASRDNESLQRGAGEGEAMHAMNGSLGTALHGPVVSDLHRPELDGVSLSPSVLDSDEYTSASLSPQTTTTSEDKGRRLEQTQHITRKLLRMPDSLKPRSSMSLESDSQRKKSVEKKLLLVGNAKSSGQVLLRSMGLAYGETSPGLESEDGSIKESIKETIFSRKSTWMRHRYRVFNVIGLHSRENKWIYSFERMSTMIFVVDISAYYVFAFDDRPLLCLQDDLALFQQICASKWLELTPILLLMSNTDLLAENMKNYPIQDYWPEYKHHATDLEDAKTFFRGMFLRLNQKHNLRVWVLFTESLVNVKLGKAVMANVDKMITEGKVLAFGT